MRENMAWTVLGGEANTGPSLNSVWTRRARQTLALGAREDLGGGRADTGQAMDQYRGAGEAMVEGEEEEQGSKVLVEEKLSQAVVNMVKKKEIS